MSDTDSRAPPSDALVVFGVTGDLARRRIFPALYALAGGVGYEVPGDAREQFARS